MVRQARLAAALLAFISALPLAAQQQEEPPRRLLLFFDFTAEARFDPVQRLLLYESLLVRLGRASDRVAVLEHRREQMPQSDGERAEAAQALRADCWLLVTAGGTWERPRLEVRSYDLLADRETFAYPVEEPLRRGAVDLERHFWDRVAASVRETYTQAGRAVARAVTPGQIVFRGVAGTTVTGVGKGLVKIGADGQAAAEVLLPGTFAYRATRVGYDPVVGRVFAEQGQEVVALEQRRGTRFALSFYLENINFPGFDFSFYPVPNFLFLNAGFHTYALGFLFSGGGRDNPLVSLSLTHLNLAAGCYLSAADRRFRFYLAAGAFARLITALDFGVTLDPVAPWGLQPILGMEFSSQPKQRFYLEYAPFFYWTTSRTLFFFSLPQDNAPGLLPLPEPLPFIVQPLAVRLGWRLLL